MPSRKKKTKHPMQPVVIARDGVVRFHENIIVVWMLSQLRARGVDLTMIATAFNRTRDRDDYQHLMQLIGYSVSGYSDLSCHDRDVLVAADAAASKLVSKSKR